MEPAQLPVLDCQRYDGAENTAGQQRRCAAHFRQLAPKAPYFHCASHDLNLAPSKACNMIAIQCMVDIIKTLGLLFKHSPTKQALLEQCVESFNSGAMENGIKTIYLRKVKFLCRTRWVEQHTSILDLCILLGCIIPCLELIRQNYDENRKWDRKSITEANALLQNIYSSPFLVTLSCVQFLFGFTSIVAKLLHSQIMNVVKDTLKAFTILIRAEGHGSSR